MPDEPPGIVAAVARRFREAQELAGQRRVVAPARAAASDPRVVPASCFRLRVDAQPFVTREGDARE
eukprot:7946435-Lingulodinium_polyedra.AAC.1